MKKSSRGKQCIYVPGEFCVFWGEESEAFPLTGKGLREAVALFLETRGALSLAIEGWVGPWVKFTLGSNTDTLAVSFKTFEDVHPLEERLLFRAVFGRDLREWLNRP